MTTSTQKMRTITTSTKMTTMVTSTSKTRGMTWCSCHELNFSFLMFHWIGEQLVSMANNLSRWRTTYLDGEQVDAREARAISRAKNRTFVVRPGFVQRWNSPGFIHESATASREPGTYDLLDGLIVRSFVAISFWRTMVTSSNRADGTVFYFVF